MTRRGWRYIVNAVTVVCAVVVSTAIISAVGLSLVADDRPVDEALIAGGMVAAGLACLIFLLWLLAHAVGLREGDQSHRAVGPLPPAPAGSPVEYAPKGRSRLERTTPVLHTRRERQAMTKTEAYRGNGKHDMEQVDGELYRLRVPGGWLYGNTYRDHSTARRRTFRESPTFVPVPVAVAAGKVS